MKSGVLGSQLFVDLFDLSDSFERSLTSVIPARLVASALLCLLILLFEVEGLQAKVVFT